MHPFNTILVGLNGWLEISWMNLILSLLCACVYWKVVADFLMIWLLSCVKAQVSICQLTGFQLSIEYADGRVLVITIFGKRNARYGILALVKYGSTSPNNGGRRSYGSIDYTAFALLKQSPVLVDIQWKGTRARAWSIPIYGYYQSTLSGKGSIVIFVLVFSLVDINFPFSIDRSVQIKIDFIRLKS
jgi:hypothetical protein